MKQIAILLCALFLILASAGSAGAQSPYRRSRSRDGWIIGGCVIGAAGAVIAERSLEPIPLREIDLLSRDDVNRFDRPAIDNYSEWTSDASYLLAGAAVAAPLALFFNPEVRDDWKTYSLMYAETAALSVIIPAIAKGTVERFRPLVYNPDVPMGTRTESDGRASFFSRHTSMAFAAAVFLCTTHDTYRPHSRSSPYLWAGSLFAAAAIGIMRIESGDHFPTDVITGAAVGGAVGYLIPRLHRGGRTRLSLSPAFRGAQIGVAAELRW